MEKIFHFATVALIAQTLQVPALGRPIETWQGTETSHFAIFSLAPSTPSSTRDFLYRLESSRLFFERTGLIANSPQINILAIDSQSDSELYKVNPSAYAFYQRTHEGDFVVIRDMSAAHIPVAIHEYTHFIVEQAGLKLPLWLNEGVADLYSTIEADRTQTVLGTAPCGRENALASHPWIDWTTLTSVDHNSPYYHEADKMLLFYAQSWAMVHMLALDPQYEAGFHQFLLAVSNGATTEDAMTATYHKSLHQVGQDVQTYVSSRRTPTKVLNIDIRPASLETMEIRDATRRAALAVAQIIAACPQLAQEGASRLAGLANQYPEDPRPDETLAFQAMNEGRLREARQHFALAVEHNSQNPEVWFRLAHLKLQSEGPSEEAISLLQRVVAVQGDHYGARLELGFSAAKKDKYELAVHALEGIKTMRPEHAYAVLYTLAYCSADIEQGTKARMYAEQARKAASSDKDREEVAGLFRYIERQSRLEVASRE